MESYLPDFAWSVVADQTSNSHRAVLPRCYSFGAFELDVLAHVLCRNGIERHLEPRGFDVLLYLLMNRDRVVSKNELLEELWPTRHVTENVVARCVMKVRQTLDDRGSRQPLIRTIHRIGYRFVASAVEFNQPSVILSRSPMLVRN